MWLRTSELDCELRILNIGSCRVLDMRSYFCEANLIQCKVGVLWRQVKCDCCETMIEHQHCIVVGGRTLFKMRLEKANINWFGRFDWKDSLLESLAQGKGKRHLLPRIAKCDIRGSWSICPCRLTSRLLKAANPCFPVKKIKILTPTLSDVEPQVSCRVMMLGLLCWIFGGTNAALCCQAILKEAT